MEIIKSKDNPLVKRFILLKDNKRERTLSGQFVIEGLRFCKEAVLNNAKIHTVLMTEEFLNKHPEDAELIGSSCNNVKLISDIISKRISDTVNSQGVYCVCSIALKEQKLCGNKFIALENLQDPGNIGTVIRTAQAFGIDGVCLVGNCADIYSPKVLRSTMGTIFTMPMYRFSDINDAYKEFKNNNLFIYGAILDEKVTVLSDIKFKNRSVCLIGNEANGLSAAAKEVCDEFVFIDMPGNAESLNASVAASVIMWEMIKK